MIFEKVENPIIYYVLVISCYHFIIFVFVQMWKTGIIRHLPKGFTFQTKRFLGNVPFTRVRTQKIQMREKKYIGLPLIRSISLFGHSSQQEQSIQEETSINTKLIPNGLKDSTPIQTPIVPGVKKQIEPDPIETTSSGQHNEADAKDLSEYFISICYILHHALDIIVATILGIGFYSIIVLILISPVTLLLTYPHIFLTVIIWLTFVRIFF